MNKFIPIFYVTCLFFLHFHFYDQSIKMRQSIEEAALTHQSSTESVNSTKGNNRSSQSCKTANGRVNGSDSVSYSFRLSPPAAATKSPASKKLVKSATSSALLSTRHLQRNESISSVSSDASNDMTLDELEIIKTIGKEKIVTLFYRHELFVDILLLVVKKKS